MNLIKNAALSLGEISTLAIACSQRISHGSKVYFKNGGWVIARFSGTEPLLRIFCEMPNPRDAADICRIYEDFLGVGRR